MESLTCSRCGVEMHERAVGAAVVWQCPVGHGVFLERADLGELIEAESNWQAGSGHHTTPIPRITPDMTAPPAAAPQARAWVETLFR